MAFLRRILSGDYRRAVAAEAAGDYAEAARHYALAGERDKVAEMHLLRAERAATPGEAEAELRDALRWTDVGTPGRARVARALGNALLKRAVSEGATTARDRERVAYAARLLDEAGEHREAGSAWELIGDDEGAASAYERGGLVEEMEAALGRERSRRLGVDAVRDAFHAYEVSHAHGDRRGALTALERCVAIAEDKGEYARLHADLRARLVGGHVQLRRRPDGAAHRFAATPVRIGRDPELAIALRSPSVSRTHAEVVVAGAGFALVDSASRHGTWLHELPLAGSGQVVLAETGRFRLGTECEVEYRSPAGARAVRLEVVRGLDRGAVFHVQPPDAPIDLEPLLGVTATLRFAAGRPEIEGLGLTLNGAVAGARIQLAHGDILGGPGGELDVL